MNDPNAEDDSNPDELNWPMIAQTVQLVQLSAGQIDMAIYESNESVDVLSDSFLSVMSATKEIEKVARSAGFGDDDEIVAHCKTIAEQTQGSVVAFQFYDKLVQRLQHVVDGLGWLTELISDEKRVQSNVDWMGLQDRILDNYSMKEEQEMFDALINGATLEEALALGRQALIKIEEEEVELF